MLLGRLRASMTCLFGAAPGSWLFTVSVCPEFYSPRLLVTSPLHPVLSCLCTCAHTDPSAWNVLL